MLIYTQSQRQIPSINYIIYQILALTKFKKIELSIWQMAQIPVNKSLCMYHWIEINLRLVRFYILKILMRVYFFPFFIQPSLYSLWGNLLQQFHPGASILANHFCTTHLQLVSHSEITSEGIAGRFLKVPYDHRKSAEFGVRPISVLYGIKSDLAAALQMLQQYFNKLIIFFSR